MADWRNLTLGQRVRGLRKRRRMKQVDLARTVGCSASRIGQIENDYPGGISADLMMAIAREFGLTKEQLRTGTIPEPAQDRQSLRETLVGLRDQINAALAHLDSGELSDDKPPFGIKSRLASKGRTDVLKMARC